MRIADRKFFDDSICHAPAMVYETSCDDGEAGDAGDGAGGEGDTGGSGSSPPESGSSPPAEPPQAQHQAPPATPPIEAPPQDEPPEDADPRFAEQRKLYEQQQKQLDEQRAEIAKQKKVHRQQLLEGAGVKGKYHRYAPDVDPYTDDGKAELEKWVSENPEFCVARTAPAPVAEYEKVAKKVAHTGLIDMDDYRRSYGG